ncbi:FBP domain-containing protein [Gordonia sp. X0973]|uniref:FBP domain-containing protein n=1 Tax=Gordonia sp. X0973 TaxID=2742602 RepID=UPI000F53A4E4|nr:FBP domain-containing protein [Gordonia sp. X0973]QKT07681.1 FBP domain-containing protein [Gordonia sp. X0973]
MQPLSQTTIRSAFRGATRSEVARVTYPDLADVDFARLEFLGWRDPKIPRRAYLVVDHDDGPVALLLTRAESKPRGRAMCSWCSDVNLSDDAVLYTVRRAGAAGRRGCTLGVLICEKFGCSRNARQLPPAYHRGTDLEQIRDQRVAELRRRIRAFVDEVLTDVG